MATKIVTKNSSTASAVPTASDLVQGELAVNVADKRLFTEDNAGAIVELGTNPSALTVAGEITANGGIALGDNDKATFGAGDDLQIYHDGSNSYIDEAGQGTLYVRADSATTIANPSNTLSARFRPSTSVSLYYSGSEKLATTSTGIDVTGTATMDGLTVDGGRGYIFSGDGYALGLAQTSGQAAYGYIGTETNGDINISDTSGNKIAKFQQNQDISFYEDTGTTPKFFWDASAESLGIGTSSPSTALEVSGAVTVTRSDVFNDNSTISNEGGLFTISAATGGGGGTYPMLFKTAATERMRIDSSGNVGIGTSSPDTLLHVNGQAKFENNVTLNETSPALIAPSGDLRIFTGGSESMRIDSSGHTMFATTDDAPGAGNTQSGVAIRGGSDNRSFFSASSNYAMHLNRNTNDGEILYFAKNGTAVGSIGTETGNLNINSASTGMLSTVGTRRLNWDADQLYPMVDNDYNLGYPSYRFDDIYATNATIQTSDRNEKQDVVELSDAEQRVAVAAKGLLRKFRWKDSVAEKGDEARTHFGIIAQDLQAAFAAEGLDAGDYAMFISTTWTDEETNEEKTRMGVRYSELLAFIIAAI